MSGAAFGYTLVTVGLWVGLLPAMLIRDQEGVLDIPWRSPAFVVAGFLLLAVGGSVVYLAGRSLSSRGVALFGLRPGPVLVVDGYYGKVRNPIDVGTTLLALSPMAALAVDLMWVVPGAAVVYFVIGTGVYEDARLREEFGDRFVEYRAAVPKWLPRLGR